MAAEPVPYGTTWQQAKGRHVEDPPDGTYYYSHPTQQAQSELTCSTCGSVVADIAGHQRFHDWLNSWLQWLAQGPE